MSEFIWNGKEIKTMGDTMDAANDALEDGKALEFKQAYVESLTHPYREKVVNANLWYWAIRYAKPSDEQRIKDAFDLHDPNFGEMP